MAALSSNISLPGFYLSELDKIRNRFEGSYDGLAAAHERSELVDKVIRELYRVLVASPDAASRKICLVALGGYGRQELFPCSDIDLLVVSETTPQIEEQHKPLSELVRSLWDLRIRTSMTSRTLNECSTLCRDNLEFNVALVDARYLSGEEALFLELHDKSIPRLMSKEGEILLRDLAEMTEARHAKYAQTIFHLEPNLKEAPGGLRDYHVARWISLIAGLESRQLWNSPEELWPARYKDEGNRAFEFLAAVRCFLHYQREKDDNRLSYELQEKAAESGLGMPARQPMPAADWMRSYFRHARSVQRLTADIISGAQPARSGLYDLYRDWRSRVSNADFSVVRGKIFLRLPAAAQDFEYAMRLFEFVARHGLELSHEAERSIEQLLASATVKIEDFPDFGQNFCQILTLPHAAEALRLMHRSGWLEALFPEFRAIDSLVIRDFYHRYTVDEHSFLTIQNLYSLRHPEHEWEQGFGEIFSELQNPGLLAFALLFHDVGKGMADENHIDGSSKAVEQIFSRFQLSDHERETVHFLIRNHLEMSTASLHRDIFDPATVHRLAETVGSPERLKMLCLLTYADIKSVNPETLTPWKAEMLWRLYTAAANLLARSMDSERIHIGEPGASKTESIARYINGSDRGTELNEFLEGFPTRYVQTHAPEEVALHFQLAEKLREHSVQMLLQDLRHYWELTVLTYDRPYLFASLTGTLAAWGMNIVAADAFSNRAGAVLDTFRFVDVFNTLGMNPGEHNRLKRSVADVLSGAETIENLMRGRIRPQTSARVKLRVPAQIRMDDNSSTRSTLLEIIAQDRSGLLYEASRLLSGEGCDIEVALIETQGQKAIDVFYLTAGGKKLSSPKKQAIQEALLKIL